MKNTDKVSSFFFCLQGLIYFKIHNQEAPKGYYFQIQTTSRIGTGHVGWKVGARKKHRACYLARLEAVIGHKIIIHKPVVDNCNRSTLSGEGTSRTLRTIWLDNCHLLWDHPCCLVNQTKRIVWILHNLIRFFFFVLAFFCIWKKEWQRDTDHCIYYTIKLKH